MLEKHTVNEQGSNLDVALLVNEVGTMDPTLSALRALAQGRLHGAYPERERTWVSVAAHPKSCGSITFYDVRQKLTNHLAIGSRCPVCVHIFAKR